MRVTKTFGARGRGAPPLPAPATAPSATSRRRSSAASAASAPRSRSSTALDVAILLLYGGALVARGAVTLGQLVVFAGLLQQFAAQVSAMATILNTLEQSVIAARRVFEVLDAPVAVDDPPDPVARPTLAARWPALSTSRGSASATTPPSRRCRGSTSPPSRGAASRSPARPAPARARCSGWCPRFFDPSVGRVLIDGVDARRLRVDDLRRGVGVVFQESFLFRATIADNIAFGNPGRVAGRDRAGGPRGRGPRLRGGAPARLRHAARGGRDEPVGRPAPAAGDRARVAARSADPAARRSDERRRRADRGRDPVGDRVGAPRADDLARDRPPAGAGAPPM